MVSKVDAINQYDASSIKTLEGLEAVRKRPAMYIGNTNSSGLAHIVFEIFDNAVDEVLADFADNIEVTFHSDGSVSVLDNGRGIPPEALKVIFTTLHAGGKFDSAVYKSSGGLHGVGTSVTNAMSEWLEVTVYRNGKEHYLKFENGGHPIGDMKVIGKCDKNKTGTLVRFKPDATLFSTVNFNIDRIELRTRETAFLNPTLKVIFNDFRSEEVTEHTTKIFDYTGMSDYLEYLANGSTVSILPKEYTGVDEETGMEMTVAFQWIENDDNTQENILSYVNNIRTRDGGTHETGFKSGLTKAFNQYGKDAGLLKGKYNKVLGEDIRDGIVAVISVKIPENILEFESQTKDKLGTYQARAILDNFSYNTFLNFLGQNKSDAEYLIDRAIKYQKMKEEAKRLKETTKKGSKNVRKAGAPDKLTLPSGKDKTKTELFVVEGNSAAGSAKDGRYSTFQGVLALRGKVLNTEEKTFAEAMNNAELKTLDYALGCGSGSNYNEDDLQFNKLIILTDADDDGSHIQVLLLTHLFKHYRKLIEDGHVYVAQPPLYLISKGKEHRYAWNQTELRQITEEMPKGAHVKRFKGLGEMDATQLRDTTLNPENRVLLKVTINDFIQATSLFSGLMGGVAEKRRVWINQNVEFAESIDANFINLLDTEDKGD